MFRILIEDIRDFHVKHGLGYDGPPRALLPEMFMFRHKFMIEEANEWSEAQGHLHAATRHDPELVTVDAADVTHNMAKALDAIVDVIYITLGNAYLQGFTEKEIGEAWQRVHAANMQKIRGPSARSDKFDIVKPPGWEPPKLDDLVEHHIYSKPKG